MLEDSIENRAIAIVSAIAGSGISILLLICALDSKYVSDEFVLEWVLCSAVLGICGAVGGGVFFLNPGVLFFVFLGLGLYCNSILLSIVLTLLYVSVFATSSYTVLALMCGHTTKQYKDLYR